jgi:lambda repressor-like predicted transcriptional regulator
VTRPWTNSELSRAVELRRAGLSLRQVARELGRAHCGALSRLLAGTGDPGEAREMQGAAAAARNREACALLGWPEVIVPGQARILAALSRGPLTARQLAGALGLADRRTLRRRLLSPLLRPQRIDGGPKGAACSYVVRLPGWPPRYALSAWLAERKQTSD